MKVVNVKKKEFTHFIGRPSVLGNPFVVSSRLSRESAIRLFETYARLNQKTRESIASLPENAILGCYCKPLACHGDVIIKLWNEMQVERTLKG